MLEPLLTVEAAAKVLSLNRFTVYELIRDRKLVAVRVGPKNGGLRLRVADLEAYAAKNLTVSGEPEPIGAA